MHPAPSAQPPQASPVRPPGRGVPRLPQFPRPPRLTWQGRLSHLQLPSFGRLYRAYHASPISARTGLQGKLVLCFMLMLTSALGVSCWMFVTETREAMDHMAGEQAAQVRRTLVVASHAPPEQRNAGELSRLGADLLKVDNEARIRNVELSVVLIGAVAVLVSLPVMYWLVHRVFRPIRQLVAATDRIARGDLETRVAIDRDDVIGTLARSFNEMVKRVRSQQEALARANHKLATANARLAEANLKLSDANRDLEEKVRQRTAQVEAAARQVSAANRRLSSEIAEKEDFLRAVSHDLNAPLRNISGMAGMLLMKYREVFDPDVVHRLERIQRNVEVETGLIGELLELSRIKTRRQRMEAVDLNDLLSELRELFAQDLETRRISLLLDHPLPALNGERARLRQVFQNLIDNAIKYMGEPVPSNPSNPSDAGSPAGPGVAGKPREIHVGCALRLEEAEFYVRDTGIGIEPDDVDKVFHVFRRGKSQAVKSVAGKGVGLASVKSIIETYSGTIWVESRVGEGSVFRFTINGKYVPQAGTGGTAGTGGIPAPQALGIPAVAGQTGASPAELRPMKDLAAAPVSTAA